MVEFNEIKVMGIALFAACVAWAAEMMPLAECREKAAAGDVEAQYQLGQRYEEGSGVAKNGIRAVIQYKKAAERKHRKACARLSDLYSRGEYVKKDTVLAAKYRAWAEGENDETAVAKAAGKKDAEKIDEIEVALDYLLGRNGKERDPKTGIRVLYSAAKDNPTAQRVFVKRWCTGDLDDAFGALSGEEIVNIIPWFEDAYRDGIKRAGYILGLVEYEIAKDADFSKKASGYRRAETYWMAAGKSGMAKSWYMLGRNIYCSSEKDEQCAKKLRWMNLISDTKAKDAFLQALRISPKYEDARWCLGLLYLLSDDSKCADSRKAFQIFEEFYKRDNANKFHVYYYGYAGWWVAVDAINKDLEIYKKAFSTGPQKLYYDAAMKRREQYERLVKQKEHYLKYIEQAAHMGCESAQKFIARLKSKSN